MLQCAVFFPVITFLLLLFFRYTAFPTFYAPQTAQWWADNTATFRASVPVDGLWIDINEASNFCTGDCDRPTLSLYEEEPKPSHQLETQGVRRHRRGAATLSPKSELPRRRAPPKSLCDGSATSALCVASSLPSPVRVSNCASLCCAWMPSTTDCSFFASRPLSTSCAPAAAKRRGRCDQRRSQWLQQHIHRTGKGKQRCSASTT